MKLPGEYRSVHIGMGGWDLHPFHDSFYPRRPGNDFRKLGFYSQFFDCVEVNSTFYNTTLSKVSARRWLNDVSSNKNFLFTVKLYRGFTHTYDATASDIASVHTLLEPLVEHGKFGGLLIQFPYLFTNRHENRRYVLQLSRIFSRFRLFLEVRHRSWYSPLMYNFFQENRLHLVNVDLPQIRQHVPLTSHSWCGAGYFRMMGRNGASWKNPWRLEHDRKHVVSDRYRYNYSAGELDSLRSLIDQVKAIADQTFVIFHNDPEANSLVNGFQLKHLLKSRRRVLVPRNFLRSFPVLKPISAAVNTFHPLFDHPENASPRLFEDDDQDLDEDQQNNHPFEDQRALPLQPGDNKRA
jgi:uncharacterized protein YecE (DUF72 family)